MEATQEAHDSVPISEQRIFRTMFTRRTRKVVNYAPAPLPSATRLEESLTETAHDLDEFLEQPQSKNETVLYLAYGSNLSKETFRGNRGIKPLSQINVQVPALRLTFDLPGIAYAEPCFANTAERDPENDSPKDIAVASEGTPLLNKEKSKYNKDQWHKGVVGVVYEVTKQDYAHIIATEGGGSSYQDILIDCHPFASSDPKDEVPQNPTTSPFKAHTLFAPVLPPGKNPPKHGGRLQRPDTSYAQASARYLKLLTDGAAELELPFEYQDYLLALKPYKITKSKQRIGQFVFLALWAPVLAMVFLMGRTFADKKGRQPNWLRDFSAGVFKGAWGSYDYFFKKVFGDGERTIEDGGDDEDKTKGRSSSEVDLEKGKS